MSSADYFRLIFHSPLKDGSVDVSARLWVFDRLTERGFKAAGKELSKNLAGTRPLALSMEACQDLCDLLRVRLKNLLGPVLQANYTALVQRIENEGIAPKERTEAQEAEIQRWFLQTMKSEGTGRLFGTNPYLRETALKFIDMWTAGTDKFLQRLERDLGEISRQTSAVGKPRAGHESMIKSLRCGLSDPHRDGETVKIVELADGRQFAYKPRALSPEKSFYRFLDHLGKQGFAPRPYTPWVIDKRDYGWMEYCQPLTQLPPDLDIEQYARQFGALSALWYLVGGTDMHHENILFTDKGVVIVDCETIFEADFDYYFLDGAPILPRLEPTAVNHSILGTQALASFASDLNAQKQTVSQVGGIADFRKLFKNNVKDQKESAPDDWSTQPVMPQRTSWQTFTDTACEAIGITLRHFRDRPSQETIAAIKECFGEGVKGRLVFRPTSNYGALLHNLSLQFKVLQRRDTVVQYISEQLDKIPASYLGNMDTGFLKRSEVAQLANFDIPYLARELGRNYIYSSSGFDHRFEEDLDFSSLKYRIAWLKEPSFIEDEIHLAKIALSPWAALEGCAPIGSEAHQFKKYHRRSESFYACLPPGKESALLRTLSKIAEQIQTESEHLNDAEYAFYFDSFGADDCQPAPISYSLFNGWAGKLLFLGCYGAITSQVDVIRLVNKKLEYFVQLGRNEKYVLEHGRGGISSGYQSMMYVFECLKRLGVLDNYPPVAARKILSPGPDSIHNYDLVGGASGGAILADLLKAQVSPTQLLEWGKTLKRSMQKLIAEWAAKSDKQRLGLAHGALGPCLAASRLYRTNQDAELKSLAFSLAAAEEKLLQERRRKDKSIETADGWCYGNAGRALAYYGMGRDFGAPELIDKAREIVATKDKGFEFANHTLCCGSLGFIAARLTVNKGLPKYQDKIYRLRVLNTFYDNPRSLLDNTKKDSACMMPTGLFYGMSGLGMVILYYLDPDNVPSVWTFE